MTVDETKSTERKRAASLEAFFSPRSVAVIGPMDRASGIARRVFENLQAARPKFAVSSVNSLHPTFADLPESIDLALVATPATTVPGLLRDCAAKGARGAVVLSGGFRERGPEGADLERQVVAEARRGNLRVIGPNCLGIMAPLAGLNATSSSIMAARGSVAFLSQSGALCTAMLDWSERECVGFSAIFSVGSMADVGWGDLIHFLGEHPDTRAIVLYMEQIGDARSFMSAAREVALRKPIIVIKAGGASSDAVLNAAFRRSGVVRVNNLSDIFYMVEVLAKQPRPRGPRLTIVSNAGGPGLLAADSLVSTGGRLAELPPAVLEPLHSFLPEGWSGRNPIDLLGDADAERFRRALRIAMSNPESDGLLVILSPQGLANPTDIAESLRDVAVHTRKPILASWMGGQAVSEGVRLLNRAGVPMFPYPDTAAKAFTYLWQYSYRLQGLYETPSFNPDEHSADQKLAGEQLIDQVRQQGRAGLDETESKKLLALYGIPTVPTSTAPLQNKSAYELLLGSRSDPEFGPVLVFGAGGELADVMDDRSFGLAPLTTTLARRMMEQTRIWKALKGLQGRAPINTDALEELLVRFSRLVVEQRWIREIDINPLFAGDAGLLALNARVAVYDRDTAEKDIPKPAIRPYPIQYVQTWLTNQNVAVTIRPIRPEDERSMVDFHQRLSERTVHQRYFHYLNLEARIAHERLANICFVDYDRQMVLVAERANPETEERELVGVARLMKLITPGESEFAVLIADHFQGHGLGTEMVRRLIQIAREEGLSVVRAEMLAENSGMISLCRKLGFTLRLRVEECTMEAELSL